MTTLWTILIGLVIGAVARLFMPGKDPGGLIVTMLIGVAGALLALYLGRALGFYAGRGQGPGLIASVLGAVALLGVHRLVRGN